MTTVLLGNTAPLNSVRDVAGVLRSEAAAIGNTVTTVSMRDGFDDADEVALALSTYNDRLLSTLARGLADDQKHYAIGLREIDDLWWPYHSSDPPEWVESDDVEFAEVLADHFSDGDHECVVGRPEDWVAYGDEVEEGGEG